MNLLNLSVLDFVALACFLLAVIMFNLRVERETASPPSTYALMVHYRTRWMEVLTTRDNRIVDTTILGILQQSARFFASGMMIAIGAVVALMSRPELQSELEDVFHYDIAQSAWNMKLFFTGLVLASGFLSFLWSGRLFGYCAIVMASIPEDGERDAMLKEAHRAARINITASKSFNRGMRLIYFALASLCWLLGSIPFLLATLIVTAVVYRREYRSHSRAALMEGL